MGGRYYRELATMTTAERDKLHELWSSVEAAPPQGTSLKHDIWELAFWACFNGCGYDISILEKDDHDEIYLAILDVWTNWPEENEEAEKAAVETLRSIAVAGGWEEVLLMRLFDPDC